MIHLEINHQELNKNNPIKINKNNQSKVAIDMSSQ